MMDESRLQDIVLRAAQTRVLVVGDFVLDRRLQIDPARIERSEETGLPAHQVVAVTIAPGAAGHVAAALRALGSAVVTLGVIGDDGDGYELRRSLRALGIVVLPSTFNAPPPHTPRSACVRSFPSQRMHR